MNKFLAGKRHETDKLKTNFFPEMQASQGVAATASQGASALKSSIAKHESAFSFVRGVLIVERAGRASDADQAQMMHRIHEET